jgi:hypothetical protein
MIYRCIEHYDFTSINEIIINDDISNTDIDILDVTECFICLDASSSSTLFKVNDLCIGYYKYCSCSGIVHKNCLDTWFMMSSNKCPICRINMKQKLPTHIVVIENSKHYIFMFANKSYGYFIFINDCVYTILYNAIHIIAYFVGILHLIKLIAIAYMVCEHIIFEKEKEYIYANHDL